MNLKNTYRAICAGLAWVMLALQYYLILTSGEHDSFGAASLYFFGFFTILTNILVALAFTAPLLKPQNRLQRFFERPAVRAAIALYILVVAVVYHVMLAGIHHPEGLNVLTNIALHTALPVLYIVDWLFFACKSPMSYARIPFWVIYPFAYGLFNILRGMLTGFYPYPFIDISKLGPVSVAINMAAFTAAYAIGAAIFIIIGKILSKRGFAAP